MFETYSRRNRFVENDPDVYEYDNFNEKLRVQLFLIVDGVLKVNNSLNGQVFDQLYQFIQKEFGVYYFDGTFKYNSYQDFNNYWMMCNSEEFIDILDLVINYLNNIDGYMSPVNFDSRFRSRLLTMNDDINFRLKQNSMGYEIVVDKLISMTNVLMHLNVVKPALLFLHQEEFKGAEEEIHGAFDYLKDNDYKNTVLYAAKAFESTMKTICSLRKYKYNTDKDTAKELINILTTNKYIPQYLENHLHALRTTLESGLPTLRNKTGGHGQGEEIVELQPEFARYALNLTCTNILFLADLY